MNLIIHAPNIHKGGGRTLLSALLAALPEDCEYTLQVDARLALPTQPSNITMIRVPPTLAGRYAAERRLPTLAGDAVLCMGNLPPLFNMEARSYLLMQNRYLCESASLDGFSTSTKMRIHIERMWLRARVNRVAQVIVQTRSMQDCVRRAFGIEASVIPFFAKAPRTPPVVKNTLTASDLRYLYVASPEPHKNHTILFSAWRLLAEEGLQPELHVTLPQDSVLARDARYLQEAGIAIINHGEVDAARLNVLYESCHALLFPSTLESFGLPLLEAQAAGLPIIAAELDYVRDIIDPVESFDPNSALSLSRAVKRHLGVPEQRTPPLTPHDFIRRILTDEF